MTHEERGLYITLLCIQWSQGGISGDDFTRIAGASFGGSLERIKSKFIQGKDGVFRNERMEFERDKQTAYRLSRSNNGSKGGRPKKPYGKHMVSIVKPQQKPPSPSPSPSPSPDPDLQIPTPVSGRGMGKQRSISKLPDSEWINSLRANPAYAGLDIDRELGRMQAWAAERRKTPSRRRFLVWLNNADRPITVNGRSHNQPSVFELKTILEAKQRAAEDLKHKHAAEGALSTTWANEESKASYLTLRKEIKDLNSRIANYAAH